MAKWPGSRAAEQSVTRSEAFRVLRANLEVALVDLDPASVIVTSAHEAEGKTATCAQIARSFVEAGRRVVVVDLDLRNPDLHNWVDLDNVRGASDVLTERCRLDEALQLVEVPSANGAPSRPLYVLTAGASVANPTELLGGQRTVRLLASLADQTDILLIDTPPVLPVADTLVISRIAAGALLVVDHDTSIESARAAKDALVRNHARVLGVVLNRFEPRAGGDGVYGYGEPAGVEE